jgi:hypothetical protein
MADFLCLSLYADMTDDEIKDCIQQMMPVCKVKQQGFCLTVGGFDKDPRELWEIPESVAFFKKLVDLGFIAALEVSTTASGLVREDFFGVPKLPGFGALEVWMCATGRMAKGNNDVDAASLMHFERELEHANAKALATCKEPPYNTGMKTNAYPEFVYDWKREMR